MTLVEVLLCSGMLCFLALIAYMDQEVARVHSEKVVGFEFLEQYLARNSL